MVRRNHPVQASAGHRIGRGSAVLAAVALVASVLVLLPMAPARAAWSVPAFVRSIGGNGRPGLFAWGVQYNPVTQEVLIGDYLNYRIRRFDLNGNFLGDFFRTNNKGQPYSIAVDPIDGDIYVSEVKDNPFMYAIAKYDKGGGFLYEFVPPHPPGCRITYQVWMTVADDGHLWALDSHLTHNNSTCPPRVVKYAVDDAAQTFTEVEAITALPPGTTEDTVPRMYGIDVASSGTIYATDARNRRVHMWDQAGNYLGFFGLAETGGDNRGVAVNDATGRVYVVDAQHSDIDVFDTGGAYLFSFGSEGTGSGQFAGGGRQIAIDRDGNVWVADFGNFRAQKFDPDGNFLLEAPNPVRRPASGFFAEPRDVDVDPLTGNVWVADSWNQRFQRFRGSDGAFLGAWGSRGSEPPYGMNYPRGIGVDNANRRLWVAQERGHHYKVYALPSVTWVRNVGGEGLDDTDPGHLLWPNDVEFYGGMAFISDRMSRLVKIFDATTYVELQAISISNRGLAVDPTTGNLYVIERSGEFDSPTATRGIYRYVLDAGTATYVPDPTFGGGDGSISGPPGSGNGQFTEPKDAVVINGVLYVSDDRLSRIQAFDLEGTFLGRWGGYGSGPYEFKNCSGLARDAQGRLYVADAGNDRIQVFDTNIPRPANEASTPNATVSSPANNAVLSPASLQMTGTAGDNSWIAAVEVAVQDSASGLWWNGYRESWGATKVWNQAAWTGSLPATSVNWSWWFTGVTPGASYRAEVRSRDRSNNVTANAVVRNFSFTGGSPPSDTGPPDTTISVPVNGQEVILGDFQMSGSANDNVGVTDVEIAIQDSGTGQWWDGVGWSSTQLWHPATVSIPGGTSTDWTFTWTPPAVGTYQVSAQGRDAAPNVDPTPATASFSVVAEGTPDTIPPDTSVTFPSNNQTVPPGAITFTGGATDNVGVTAVDVAIRNRSTGQWWNGSGWVSTFRWLSGAVLDAPGAASTGWSYAWTPPANGPYAVTVRARDAADNADPTRPWVKFEMG